MFGNNLSAKLLTLLEQELSDLGFKFPDQDLFRDRILKVCDVDISEYQDGIIALRTPFSYEVIMKNVNNKNYILAVYIETEVKNSKFYYSYKITPEFIYSYNNFVLYKDESAFELLENLSSNSLNNLVIEYGYNEDKNLVKYVFEGFDFYDENKLHDLIFSYNAKMTNIQSEKVC